MAAPRRAAAGVRGDLDAAPEHHLASMEHFEAIGAEWAVANVGSDIALVVEARGDLDAAVAFTERAMLAARRLNLQLAEIQLGPGSATCCCARATSRAPMRSTRRRWRSPSRWAPGSATA